MGVLSAVANPKKGTVVLSAQDVPDGTVLLTRTKKGVPTEVRGGDFVVSTGGFFVEDPEAPFGDDLLTYTVVDTVTDRYVQTNLALNPKGAVNTNNWLSGLGRSITQELATALIPPRDAVTSLKVTPNTAGAASGALSDRILAHTPPSGFGPGSYFFSGQVNYTSPDLWEWIDVKAQGTWNNLKATKGTWSQVQSSSSVTGQQAFATVWAAVLGPTLTTTELRRNYCSNPSFEVNTTGWSAIGTATLARSTAQKMGTGAASLLATLAAGAAGSGGASFTATGLTPGQVYTFSASLYVPTGSTAAQPQLSVNGASVTSSAVTTAGIWTRVSCTWTATATSHILSVTNGATATAGQQVYVDQVMAEAGPVLNTYFDGDSLQTGAIVFSWSGTANASPAVAQVTDYPVIVAPFQVLGAQVSSGGRWLTFQANVDIPAGAPANCRLAILHGSTQREFSVTWHLTTLLVSKAAEVARGVSYFDGDSVPPASTDEDWTDVSHDSAMTWTGTPNNSPSVFTGPSLISSASAVQLTRPTDGVIKAPVLLSDPVAPQLALWFELQKFGDLTYPARMDQYDVLARKYRIAVSQLRGAPTGQLTLVTYSNTDADIAELLFASGRILLFRNPDEGYQETYEYLAIGDTVKGSLADGADGQPQRLWTVPFTVVERPTGLIEASTVVTWGAAKAGYATWADIFRARTNWLDAALVAPGA